MNPKSPFPSKENEKVKTTDGREVFIHRSIALVCIVVAYVQKEQEYFLLTSVRGKNTPDFQGYHCCPCGYLDWDETAVQGAMREVWEETNIYLEGVALMNEKSTPYPIYINNKKVTILQNQMSEQPYFVQSNPSSNRQNVTLYFGCMFTVESLACLPKPSGKNVNRKDFEEVERAEWVSMKEVRNKKFKFAFNHDDRAIQYIQKFK